MSKGINFYKTVTGEIIAIRYASKNKSGHYSFNITPHTIDIYKHEGVSKVLMVLGDEGYKEIEIDDIYDYVSNKSQDCENGVYISMYNIIVKSNDKTIIRL